MHVLRPDRRQERRGLEWPQADALHLLDQRPGLRRLPGVLPLEHRPERILLSARARRFQRVETTLCCAALAPRTPDSEAMATESADSGR